MARKPRLEVEGGLYHLITRGVDRRVIFHQPEDYGKFLGALATQKEKLPFRLYAYCVMTSHLNGRICRPRSSLPIKPDRCPNTATPGGFLTAGK